MTKPMAVDLCARKAPARRLVQAWTVQVIVILALRTLRFHRIERAARLLSCWATQSATASEVAGLLDVIDRVSRWLPARVACLERSLAVLLWCGLHRRSVCWRLGVRTPPFAAHAWIEIAGDPVGELVPVQSYLPILTIDSPIRSAGVPRFRARH